ncbi:hypothetical protein FZEAL_8095 [Fusarium zealandicum]|uniref:Uncharacterized protein n=1 Tax=Fusarium zealandicum TaxID=1053134 RepID=A0A8H4XH76_9HYPO|nr:hypothetical protein FZEAL_8095 [Fusarium zealandicum]
MGGLLSEGDDKDRAAALARNRQRKARKRARDGDRIVEHMVKVRPQHDDGNACDGPSPIPALGGHMFGKDVRDVGQDELKDGDKREDHGQKDGQRDGRKDDEKDNQKDHDRKKDERPGLQPLITSFLHSINNSIRDILYSLLTSVLNALSIILFSYRFARALMPDIIINTMVNCIITLALILFTLSLAVDSLLGAYCTTLPSMAPPWVPAHLAETPPGCAAFLSQTPTHDTLTAAADSLQGFVPRVPTVFDFLYRSLGNVESKVSAAHHLVAHSAASLSVSEFKEAYRSAAHESQGLEREFTAQRRLLWGSVDQFIRGFHRVEPSQSWWWDLLFFVHSRRTSAIREQNEKLQAVLGSALDDTSEFLTKLPHDRMSSSFGDMFNHGALQFSANLHEAVESIKGASPEAKELFASTAVWSGSSEAIADLLDGRGEMLNKDTHWLRRQMEMLQDVRIRLERGRGRYSKEQWTLELDRTEKLVLDSSVEWRKRLKGYFVQAASE